MTLRQSVIRKKKYYGVTFEVVDIFVDSPVLAASIVMNEAPVILSGQEMAGSFNFESGSGSESGKYFNHEWE